MAEYTPMIKQYLTIKADYKDAFLFFRLGDFYEMFFEDAINASQILEITLTARDGGTNDKIPMCGVPYHAAAGYIEQLVNQGHKVAIAEQTEDPKQAKGVVKREVIQLITPGTVMEGKNLLEKENNFLASVTSFSDDSFGFALTDLTTGENRVSLLSFHFDDVIGEIYANGVKEVVVSSDFDDKYRKALIERCSVTLSYEDNCTIANQFEQLIQGLEDEKMVLTYGRLLNYLMKTQKRSLDHLQEVRIFHTNQFMKIDLYSKRNLELTETIRSKGKKGSLLWLLDQTVTAMGGRLLKQWIDRPLLNKSEIESRHNMVQTFIEHYFERLELRDQLKGVYDLERLAGRVAYGNVNARDLLQLKKSLEQVPGIYHLVTQLKHPYATNLAKQMDLCESLTELLQHSIKESPPLSIKEGDIIKDGFNATLDQYRDASRNGKTWIASLEKQEREKTGIKSLKIGYNRVFGYYIEVSKANLQFLPEGMYERKQTLSNAERFITPELKEKETLILEAEEKIVQLEYDLFIDIREQVKGYIPRLQALAKVISELDVLQCFATISEERHYCKPQFSEEQLFIKDGRHPVVEKVMQAQEYVPNDCVMQQGQALLLITGPNMSGKSTYMRQIALTSILAQIGCFVPAREAVLPIYDQVFTRIGAADDLISGQSTFMVEMLEAKNALVNATSKSLLLFDEIGRGTSTYDGMALAQAIIEHIHQQIGAHTLFSTHYHELTDLETKLENVKNIHVSAIEENDNVVFLHKVKEGAADKSYGIHVAKLAELPDSLIERAKEILGQLEQTEKEVAVSSEESERSVEPADNLQLSFFGETKASYKMGDKQVTSKEKDALKSIKEMDILGLTPLEAINKLYELQKQLKG
ncbi:DNA mismatch repair protein MutS [Bacillus sinesaloumensis]|uniref:DNA mismatch repair protein MutS n=1 Tax=Litchfieldia sinesaloumensis TaxID=1926280 RepID=UPI0009886897|nr:DNA mismatch repair protein MutS [Bacillus sinesaloumensis]